MNMVATHIRIFDPAPGDDFVAKRTAAVDEIAKAFAKRKSVDELLRTSSELAQAVELKGPFPERIGKEIEAAISKSAVSFVAEKNELQMATCGMLGALQMMDVTVTATSASQVTDVLALGLWSALTFQKPNSNAKLEALCTEVAAKAHALVMKRASATRARIPVPDMKFPKVVQSEAEPLAADVSFAAGAADTVEALRANAAVDREEIDLLWWVLSDRSNLLKRSFSAEKNATVRAIACGLEAGQLLRRVPAEAHQHLVLRNVVDDAAMLSLPDVIKTVTVDQNALISPFANNSTLIACPAVFPLLTALRNGASSSSNAKQKRSLEDWALRALLESAILRVTSVIPSVAV